MIFPRSAIVSRHLTVLARVLPRPPPRPPSPENENKGTSDSFGLVYEERTGDVNATLHLEKMDRRTKFTRGVS